MSRGKYTWEETQTTIGQVVLIIPSNDSHNEADTYDSVRQIVDQLIEEGWNVEDIFISRLILVRQ